MTGPLSRFVLFAVGLLCATACTGRREIAGLPGIEASISDAVHEGGTPGFFFLPPMVAQPTTSGAFDAEIAILNPAIAICDVSNGPDTNCGGSGGTPAIIVFTTTSTPSITVERTTPQYQVNWDTRGAGFMASHTYRVHVVAGASGARRELGFADVFLTTTPGQAKFVETGDIIVLNDGRTLPIHFRVETGIAASLTVNAATPCVPVEGSDQVTATVWDLHGVPLTGVNVAWSVLTTPASGVGDATLPLSPTSGTTGAAGTAATTFKAGTTTGTASITAASSGFSATGIVTVVCACTNGGTSSAVTGQIDPFDGTVIDLQKWMVSAPLGASTVAQNDALLLTSDGTLGVFCNTPGLFGPGAGVALRKKLTGDFDIQVDFGGFSGPSVDYIQAFFNVYQDQDNQLHIKRIRGSSIDGIQTVAKVAGVLSGSNVSSEPVTSGTFRIVRTGSQIATFFNGAPRYSISGFSGDVVVSLISLGQPSAATASVSFDNFTINSGTLVGQ